MSLRANDPLYRAILAALAEVPDWVTGAEVITGPLGDGYMVRISAGVRDHTRYIPDYPGPGYLFHAASEVRAAARDLSRFVAPAITP